MWENAVFASPSTVHWILECFCRKESSAFARISQLSCGKMQYLHHHQPSTESMSVFVGKSLQPLQGLAIYLLMSPQPQQPGVREKTEKPVGRWLFSTFSFLLILNCFEPKKGLSFSNHLPVLKNQGSCLDAHKTWEAFLFIV